MRRTSAWCSGLPSLQVALGLTRGGSLDVQTQQPIEAVFLLLSPSSGATLIFNSLRKPVASCKVASRENRLAAR